MAETSIPARLKMRPIFKIEKTTNFAAKSFFARFVSGKIAATEKWAENCRLRWIAQLDGDGGVGVGAGVVVGVGVDGDGVGIDGAGIDDVGHDGVGFDGVGFDGDGFDSVGVDVGDGDGDVNCCL